MGVIRIARQELTCCRCGCHIRKGKRYMMESRKASNATCLSCVHGQVVKITRG